MSYNLEAMERVLEWAEDGGDDGEVFDLRKWAVRLADGESGGCGTTLCLAGKAAKDAGHEFLWQPRNDSFRVTHEAKRVVLPDGSTPNIKQVAATALGLRECEAQSLFVPELEFESGEPDEADEEVFAMDFLRYLVRRAQDGSPNMTGQEVIVWVQLWCEDYEENAL